MGTMSHGSAQRLLGAYPSMESPSSRSWYSDSGVVNSSFQCGGGVSLYVSFTTLRPPMNRKLRSSWSISSLTASTFAPSSAESLTAYPLAGIHSEDHIHRYCEYQPNSEYGFCPVQFFCLKT